MHPSWSAMSLLVLSDMLLSLQLTRRRSLLSLPFIIPKNHSSSLFELPMYSIHTSRVVQDATKVRGKYHDTTRVDMHRDLAFDLFIQKHVQRKRWENLLASELIHNNYWVVASISVPVNFKPIHFLPVNLYRNRLFFFDVSNKALPVYPLRLVFSNRPKTQWHIRRWQKERSSTKI